MAPTWSMVLLLWLQQLTSCWTSVVIAVAAGTFHSGTVAVSADVVSVSPAKSVVSVSAGRRSIRWRMTDGDCDDNDDDDNSDDDSSDWQSNWRITESSRTCRVWHRGTARHHCTYIEYIPRMVMLYTGLLFSLLHSLTSCNCVSYLAWRTHSFTAFSVISDVAVSEVTTLWRDT